MDVITNLPLRPGALLEKLMETTGIQQLKKETASGKEYGSMTSSLWVLVVEDNEFNRQVATGFLTKMGHRWATASNGEEALTLIKRFDYDIVLMDVQMPVMDGLAATMEIRAMKGPKAHIPIIAVTANAMSSNQKEYLAAGMDDYIAKPITPKRLAEVLEQWGEQTISARLHQFKSPPP